MLREHMFATFRNSTLQRNALNAEQCTLRSVYQMLDTVPQLQGVFQCSGGVFLFNISPPKVHGVTVVLSLVYGIQCMVCSVQCTVYCPWCDCST